MLTLLLGIFIFCGLIGFLIKAVFWATKVWLKISLVIFILGIIVYGVSLLI